MSSVEKIENPSVRSSIPLPSTHFRASTSLLLMNADSLRSTLARNAKEADEAVLEYLVNVAGEENPRDEEQLCAVLCPLIEQFNLAPDEASARALLRGVVFDKRVNQSSSSTHTTAAKPPPMLTSTPIIPTTGSENVLLEFGDSSDDWGTAVMPVRQERNVVVERIESTAERRRREKKEAKAAAQEQREAERELSEIQYEQSVGVAKEITASVSELKQNGKRSSGDIYIEKLTMSVGTSGRELLSNATLKLSKGKKYGLIGRNGSGKSTLLTRISRRAFEGIPPDLSILYVNQDVTGSEVTAVQVVLRGDPELTRLRERERAALEKGDENELRVVGEALHAIDAETAEARARGLLSSLGFTTAMQDAPTKSLSGGWRMRAALASALFYSPDLLMLDEPTNGLSLDAVIWLEDYLKNELSLGTTLVVVSHDRVFLNGVVDTVILLEQEKLEYFKGDVDTYERVKHQQRVEQQRVREAQLGQIAHMQKFVDRFRYNAKRASLAQSRLKAIARIEAVLEDEVYSTPEMTFDFPPPISELSGTLIRVEGLEFAYSPSPAPALFSNVDFDLEPGRKVVILGANGKGKSTFLKLLHGDLEPRKGFIIRKPNTRISMFAQHHVDQLDVTKTPLQFFMGRFQGSTELEVRPHLARFGITAELASHRIGTLSGGQKSRVAFALVTWSRPHVLLLDEPSSHLDIETCNALISACVNWIEGALVIISHDQNLITSVPDELWVMDKGALKRFPGDDFGEYKKRLLKDINGRGGRAL